MSQRTSYRVVDSTRQRRGMWLASGIVGWFVGMIASLLTGLDPTLDVPRSAEPTVPTTSVPGTVPATAAMSSDTTPSTAAVTVRQTPIDRGSNDAMHERTPYRHELDDGAVEINFSLLADGYPLDLSQPLLPQLPPAVLALAGRELLICGYALPAPGAKLHDTFFLVRHRGACCGAALRLVELIAVQWSDASQVQPQATSAVFVRGVLLIEERRDEYGLPELLFQLRAHEVLPLH